MHMSCSVCCALNRAPSLKAKCKHEEWRRHGYGEKRERERMNEGKVLFQFRYCIMNWATEKSPLHSFRPRVFISVLPAFAHAVNRKTEKPIGLSWLDDDLTTDETKPKWKADTLRSLIGYRFVVFSFSSVTEFDGGIIWFQLSIGWNRTYVLNYRDLLPSRFDRQWQRGRYATLRFQNQYASIHTGQMEMASFSKHSCVSVDVCVDTNRTNLHGIFLCTDSHLPYYSNRR